MLIKIAEGRAVVLVRGIPAMEGGVQPPT